VQNSTKRLVGLIFAVAYLVATLPGASCQPNPPQPPGPTGGSQPIPGPEGGTGAQGGNLTGGAAPAPDSLTARACARALMLCGVDLTECLRQVNQLKDASYATLSDADLQCWVDATDRAALVKCHNGVCR